MRGDDFVFFVPMILFVSIAAIVIVGIIQAARIRERLLDVVQKSIDSGTVLSPETIQAMGFKPRDDLRTGFILVAIWLAFIILGVMVGFTDQNAAGQPDFEALGPLVGVGSFPGLIGLALIGLRIARKGER